MSAPSREQVEQWAISAGFKVGSYGFGIPQRHLVDGPVDAPWLRDAIEEIAAMAYAAGQAAERKTCEVACAQAIEYAKVAEREACAKVCDDNHWEDHRLFADAIRARS